MNAELSTELLDDLAAQVLAGVKPEAERIAGQPFFAELMAEVERRPVKSRRYTGAELFLRDPEKFRRVVEYLASGRGLLWIADRLECSHHTVSAVRTHFPKAVAIEKQRLADLCEEAGRLMVEKIIENPDKVPAQAWAITAGTMIDKASLLRGGPTVLVEHRHLHAHADFNDLVDALPDGMGERGENLEQMARVRAPAPAAPAGLTAPSAPAVSDMQSAGTQRVAACATHCATPSETPPGGGGGSPVGGAPPNGDSI